VIKTTLVDPIDHVAVDIEDYWLSSRRLTGRERALLTTTPAETHGTFRSISFTSSGTTELVAPDSEGSLLLTDLVITGDKVNGGSVEVRWTDGTDTSLILKPVVTDAPVYIHMPFTGRVQGWRDASLSVIVTNNVSGSVMAVYVKAPDGVPYKEWDALR